MRRRIDEAVSIALLGVFFAGVALSVFAMRMLERGQR